MNNIYRQIFFTTTKYVLLRNIFMVITGVASIFIIRLLGPCEYGKYSLIWNLISTIGPILSLGWLSTLAKFLPEKVDIKEKSILFSQSLFSVLGIGFIFFWFFNLVVKFYPQIIPLEIKEIFLIFSLFVIVVALFNIFEGFYCGLGKFNKWTTIDGLRSNFGNLISLILLIYGLISYKVVITMNFFVSIIFLFFLFLSVKNFIFLQPHLYKIEKQIIIFCLSLLLGQIVYMLSVNLDIILLRGILKDPRQVGYYSAGIRIPKIIETMFIGHLPVPLLYYFTSNETSHLKEKILIFSSKMLGFLFGMFSLVLFTFSDYIIPFLFSNKFAESSIVFKFFALSLSILAFLVLMPSFYLSQNKPHLPVMIYFLIMVVFCSLVNIFLIPRYKFFAPVISYLISLIIYAMTICIDCYKRYKLNLILNLVGLFVFLFFSVVLEIAFNVKFLSFLIFILICFITRTVSIEDISRFKSVFIRK